MDADAASVWHAFLVDPETRGFIRGSILAIPGCCLRPECDLDDLIQQALVALVRLSHRYDARKSNPRAFASGVIRHVVLHWNRWRFRHRRDGRRSIPLAGIDVIDVDREHAEDAIEQWDDVRFVVARQSTDERHLFAALIASAGKREAARKSLGWSRERFSRVHARFLRAMRTAGVVDAP